MSRRFQFSLRALLAAIFGAGCFFGGMVVQKQLDEPYQLNGLAAEARFRAAVSI
jgi:hypothetical protein